MNNAPATSDVTNTTIAGGVRTSSGNLRFAVGSETFTMFWLDPSVDGVLTFVNAYDDFIRSSRAGEAVYHIRNGYLRDIGACPDYPGFPFVPEVTCTTGPAHDFWFWAERVYDLPI